MMKYHENPSQLPNIVPNFPPVVKSQRMIWEARRDFSLSVSDFSPIFNVSMKVLKMSFKGNVSFLFVSEKPKTTDLILPYNIL